MERQIKKMIKSEGSVTEAITFFEYVTERHTLLYESSAEFCQLFISIAMAVKEILEVIETFLIKQLSEPNLNGVDLIKEAEDVFINQVSAGKAASVIVSYASSEPIIVEGATGRYVVVINPLSGTALMDTMTPMGTIFSIYRQVLPTPNKEDFLRSATEMVGAGYALYSYRTYLVVNFGYNTGVSEFMLDVHVNEFILSEESIKVPTSGRIYCIDEGETELWDQEAVQKYILSKKDPRLGPQWDLYFSGSFVQDMYVIFKKGGILLQPKYSGGIAGRVSIVFHAAPMAYMLREAGGTSSSGLIDIVDIVPTSMKETTPFFAGSMADVEDFVKILNDVRIGFRIPWEEDCRPK